MTQKIQRMWKDEGLNEICRQRNFWYSWVSKNCNYMTVDKSPKCGAVFCKLYEGSMQFFSFTFKLCWDCISLHSNFLWMSFFFMVEKITQPIPLILTLYHLDYSARRCRMILPIESNQILFNPFDYNTTTVIWFVLIYI